MRLDDLLAGVDVRGRRGGNPDVAAVTHDSRAVRQGTLYCCLPGRRVDGHDFAADAVANGAVALLAERELPLDVAEAVVPSTRGAIGAVAAAFYGHPSRSVRVVGVTGTNGKTTTTQLIAAVLDAETIGNLRAGGLNTPEATELQARLAAFRDAAVDAVVMEVSSHSLAQHRVDGVEFAAAVFTNLTRDHLDFHGTMDDYFATKARLFEPGRAAVGVVNADDSFGRRLLDHGAIRMQPYSMDDAREIEVSTTGSTFGWRDVRITLRLPGRFNIANALAAATTCAELGVDTTTIAERIATVDSVPGRFDRVDAGQSFTVLVDYAHTPDALEQVLRAAREMTRARVIAVFGCGGDRDPGKRPVMGRLAADLADVAVLTTDNPRSEDPAAILREVEAGAPGRLHIIADRAEAIASAVQQAESDDVVVIAGKGHETGQIIGDTVLPFDDHEVARAALRDKGAAR